MKITDKELQILSDISLDASYNRLLELYNDGYMRDGENRIVEKENIPYTREEFRNLINKIEEKIIKNKMITIGW